MESVSNVMKNAMEKVSEVTQVPYPIRVTLFNRPISQCPCVLYLGLLRFLFFRISSDEFIQKGLEEIQNQLDFFLFPFFGQICN